MSSPARRLAVAPADLQEVLLGLEAVSAAVEAGAGLPEVVRAASRALNTSLIVTDHTGRTVAVAVRSPADERSLHTDGPGVDVLDLRVADEEVGRLRLRSHDASAGDSALLLVRTLLAAELRRVSAPALASREVSGSFVHDLLHRDVTDPDALAARAADLGLELEAGGSVVVARAHPHVPTDDDWRARLLDLAERGARSLAPTALAAPADRADAFAGEVVIVVPGRDEDSGRRVAENVMRELEAGFQGFTFAVGRSRVAQSLGEFHRAGNEARLAANVADGEPEPSILAFEQTGAYRLLLPAMSEDPQELQRFYGDTLEPLVAYDEQYETDLVQTLETFLDADGNVAGTAQRLFTHRHTVRYRLERVRELSGLDVGSTDGREKLSLGLKAMRVLGVAAPRGPATEAGAEGGRVPGKPR